MKFEEWWATLTASEQKLIGRTNAKFVWMEACEACAKVASGYDASPWKHDPPAGHVADMVCTSIATAIRARGNQ